MDEQRQVSVIPWFLILGGVGFLTGFVGPVMLNPESNQGPLLGIFISGPGGAVIGLTLWAVCRALHVSAKSQWGLIMVSSVLLGVAVLSACLPSPELRGYVVEVQIQKCQTPAQVTDAAIDYWQGRIEKVTWAAPRAGWREDAKQKLQQADGVVLDVTLLREQKIYRNRKPWNAETISVTSWQQVGQARSYYAEYAGASCASYALGKPTTLYSVYDVIGMSRGKGDWPPSRIQDFLNRAMLESIPDEYRQAASQ